MTSITVSNCPECGTAWTDGNTCLDDFHQMGFWEFEHAIFYEVHHLMVLSYHLQHPSLYSPDGLSFSQNLLADFLERGFTPQQVRQRDRTKLDSGQRTFKIKGTPASYGVYQYPVYWTMRATDVVVGGLDSYRENVKAWAQSVLDDLRTSGNLPAS